MCVWGDQVDVLVPIDPKFSHDGMFRWDTKPIDRCLVPLINAFIAYGMFTTNCCCGHGKGPGSIIFHDGQELHLPCIPLNT